MTSPTLPQIVEGLTEAQREVMRYDADCPTATHFFTRTVRPSVVKTTAKARSVCLQLAAKGLMERARSVWWWQQTPLGREVRTHLLSLGEGM